MAATQPDSPATPDPWFDSTREHATALPLPAPRHRGPQREACLTSASSAPQPACALLYGMATSIPGWLLSTLTSFALLASASPAPAQSQGGAGTVWGTLAKPKGRQVHTRRGQGFLAAQRVGSRRPVAGGQGLEPDCSPARHPHHVLTLGLVPVPWAFSPRDPGKDERIQTVPRTQQALSRHCWSQGCSLLESRRPSNTKVCSIPSPLSWQTRSPSRRPWPKVTQGVESRTGGRQHSGDPHPH